MSHTDALTQEIYAFIRDQLRHEQRSPTLREIAAACYVSKTTVYQHLARLEAKGWIEREMGMARSIRLGEYAPDARPTDDAPD